MADDGGNLAGLANLGEVVLWRLGHQYFELGERGVGRAPPLYIRSPPGARSTVRRSAEPGIALKAVLSRT